MHDAPRALARFYPIVPDLTWLQRVVALGAETVQLRIKDQPPDEVERQVRAAVALVSGTRCELIVNDHWQIALKAGARFVHLGQEDLYTADLAALRAGGVRFGLSTHDESELARALAAQPDYVALGPVYETKLKAMRFGPQGLDRVRDWKTRIGALPLVAIGGITPERADAVIAAGADSVAVITDFMTSTDPDARLCQWLAWSARA